MIETKGQGTFRLGLLLDTDAPPTDLAESGHMLKHLVELAALAEHSSYDGVFFPDRHMRPTTHAPSQIVNAAAVAASTNHVDIGTYCSVLPLYNPMQFAEDWSQIDQFSGGRAIVAVGGGYNADYLRFFGLPESDSRSRFKEGLEIVRRAWSEDSPWSWHGSVFNFEEVELIPRPLQQGGPPIWIAGHGQSAIDLAAELGDGLAGDPFPMPPSLWRERMDSLREAAADGGRPAPEIVMLRHVFVSESATECDEVVRTLALPAFEFYQDHGLLRERLPGDDRVDEGVVRDTVIVGDSSYCAERLLEVAHTYGLSYLIVKFLRPSFSPEARRREREMTETLAAALA